MNLPRTEDELKAALSLLSHMREMFASGNEIPVSRIVMSREEFLSLTAPAGKGNAAQALSHHAKRQIKDLVRSAYDRGYADARENQAMPGDGAPGYRGQEVERELGERCIVAIQKPI